MKNKLNLKSTDLLNKKFEVELSGYSPDEVDRYLDMALEDYRIYEELVETQKQIIGERTSLIQNKEDEVARLELELQNVKEQLAKAIPTSNAELAKEIKKIKVKLKNK